MTGELLFKDLTPEPSEALAFFDVWFKHVAKDSLISFVRIHPTQPGAKPTVLSIEQAVGAIESSGLDDLIWDDKHMYDLYYSAVTLHRPEKGRGGLRHVKEVPGVWIDLDVKDGAFNDQEACLQLLRDCPLSPTAVVLTGSGGAHGYWRLDKPVETDAGRELNLRWWSLLSDMAYPVEIDRLTDPSRVLRVPGAIRWPKKVGEKTANVHLLFSQDISYTKEQIEEHTADVWAEHLARIERTKARVKENRERAHELVVASADDKNNKWLFYMQLAGVEEMFNEKYDWAPILESQGWTCLGTDEDGRVLWSRPGDGYRKSATTDWPDSPHIMSLFSTAPETGLVELHDSEIPLTKYRVWVQLVWNGNESAAIESLLH